jgi:hypothetical protein
MITPEMKDKVLTALVDTGDMNMRCDLYKLAAHTCIDTDVLEAILSQFERLNLCQIDILPGGNIDVMLHAEAHDMVRLGGFTAQDELLKKSIEKLLLELKNLKRDFPKIAELAATVIGNLSSAVALFR